MHSTQNNLIYLNIQCECGKNFSDRKMKIHSYHLIMMMSLGNLVSSRVSKGASHFITGVLNISNA